MNLEKVEKFNSEDIFSRWRKDREWDKKHPFRAWLRNTYYLIRRTILDIPYSLRKFKWFFVRGWRGWAPNDTWGLYYYLGFEVIPKALRHLADHAHAYPGIGEFDTPEKWDKFLRDTADALEAPHLYEDEIAGKYFDLTREEIDESYKKESELYDRQKAALHKLADHWRSLWD